MDDIDLIALLEAKYNTPIGGEDCITFHHMQLVINTVRDYAGMPDLLNAVDAVLRDALDRVEVHPCDEHDDSVRAEGLIDEMKQLYIANESYNTKITDKPTCVLDRDGVEILVGDEVKHFSRKDQECQDLPEYTGVVVAIDPKHLPLIDVDCGVE